MISARKSKQNNSIYDEISEIRYSINVNSINKALTLNQFDM